jgi:4-amino-4-deoxy-L-arabinose transferase-like glycosyltransferase
MLQKTVTTEKNYALAIFVIVIGIGLAAALALYLVIDNYSLLYYWDAVSHMVAARKLVDWSENPGLGQIGTVWMPLPHFLLLPFTLVDVLFTTGFAGTALSLPCLAMGAVFLYKIVSSLKVRAGFTLPAYAGFVGAMLYTTNPNILYLGITSMTEAPFMLFFIASAYYFQRWYQNGNWLRNLLLCSVFLALATLCRYEAWFLPIFLIAVATPLTIRSKNTSNAKKLLTVAAAVLSLASIVFWLAWNQFHYGDPFEFSNAEYYSASWYAENRPFRELLFLQPANVLSIYGMTALTMYGPVLLGAGAFGYYVFRKSSVDGKKILLLFLGLPPLFTIASLLIGIGEMSYWFNSRFMILLSPLLIVMTCVFLSTVGRVIKDRVITVLAIGALFAFQLSTPFFSLVITVNDAYGGYSVKENQLAVETGEALKSLYDGNGSIMVLTGSGLEQRIMVTSGIALRNFDEIIEHSTWKPSFNEPWSYDRWLIITNHPGSDALTTTKYWLDRENELLRYYSVVYANEYYKIMLLK